MYISYVFYWCTQRGGEVPVEVLEVSQHQPAGETCWGPNIRIPKFRSLQMKNPNQSWPARMFNVHIVVFCVKDVEYFQYSFCMYSTHTCMHICNLYVLREGGYICVVYWNIERNNVPFSVEVSKQESSDELEHRLGGRCSSSRDLSHQLAWTRALAMTALAVSIHRNTQNVRVCFPRRKHTKRIACYAKTHMYISYVFYRIGYKQRGGEVPVEFVFELSQLQTAGETVHHTSFRCSSHVQDDDYKLQQTRSEPKIRIPKFRCHQMENPNQSWPARMIKIRIVNSSVLCERHTVFTLFILHVFYAYLHAHVQLVNKHWSQVPLLFEADVSRPKENPVVLRTVLACVYFV